MSRTQAAEVAELQRKAGNAAVARALSEGSSAFAGVGRLAGRRQLDAQRKVADDELEATPSAELMADDAYIDNRIVKVEYLGGEQAVVHYADGTQLTLGLVPEWVAPPVEGVDYRSTTHSLVEKGRAGTLSYIPRGRETAGEVTKSMSYGEFLATYSRDVTFKRDAASGRIVPTQVNSLTAPTLCATLRKAEAEYEANLTALARGAVRTLKVLEVALVVASFLPAGGAAAAGAANRGAAGAGRAVRHAGRTGTGAAGGAAAATARAESAFANLFRQVLSGGGSQAAKITTEGVAMSGISLTTKDGALLATYTHIVNVARTPGYGKLVHQAFEQAAVAVARSAGLGTARVGVELVENPAWAAYLESMGYAPRLVERGTTWSKMWLKVVKL